MDTKWSNRTANRIRSGEVSERIIRSMRHIMARAINAGLASWMTGTPSCTYSDASALLELIEECAPAVSMEQARKGADWLYSQVYTPTGRERQTEFAREFTERDRDIIRACKDNPRFDLVELYDARQHGARFCTLFPVYRCYGDNGAFFDYVARSWQSGGHSFIINRW